MSNVQRSAAAENRLKLKVGHPTALARPHAFGVQTGTMGDRKMEKRARPAEPSFVLRAMEGKPLNR